MPVRGVDRLRAVEVRPDAGGFGTGYRIGGRLVLTCAHLFPDGVGSSGGIRARDLEGKVAWQTEGTIQWSGHAATGERPPRFDVALVELEEGIEPVEPVAFGLLPPHTGSQMVAF